MKENVTAVMVTGKDEKRYDLAELAIANFENQTYDNKEMLIVNDGVRELNPDSTNITEIKLEERKELEELRNIALDEIGDGTLMIPQWDDDFWFHPRFIEKRVEHLDENNLDAQLVENMLTYNFKRQTGWVTRWTRSKSWGPLCATGLIRNRNVRYPLGAAPAEDIPYWKEIEQKYGDRAGYWDNPPEYMIQFVHGYNLNFDNLDRITREHHSKGLDMGDDKKGLLMRVVRKYENRIEWLGDDNV